MIRQQFRFQNVKERKNYANRLEDTLEECTDWQRITKFMTTSSKILKFSIKELKGSVIESNHFPDN